LQLIFPFKLVSIETGIVLLLFATILGFTLYTIGNYVYKAFEGYVFILAKPTALRSTFLKRQMRRYRKAVLQRDQVIKKLERVEQKLDYEIKHPTFGKWYTNRVNRLAEQQQSLRSAKYHLTSTLEYSFPPSENLIMPTRFGNVLRAAESYSKRYGIDSVPLWGRLVSAMPSQEEGGMMEKINEANNQCQFLLNGVLLGVAFACICLAATAYESILWWTHPAINHQNGQLAIIYFVIMIIAIALAWFFYEASLLNVGQFGGMIRAAIDLYRFHLLEALHLDLPKTLHEEKKIWVKLSYFVTGNLDYNDQNLINNSLESEDSIDFEYVHSKATAP